MVINNLEHAVQAIVHRCDEKKGERVVSFHLTESSWICDYVVLVSAKNSVHCKAILEDLLGQAPVVSALSPKDFYERPKVSGESASGWIIVDMNSVIVHVVTESMRDFYKLDAFFEKYGIAFHF